MRLNLTKKQLGDFLILVLFDRAFDEDFIKNNEVFDDLMTQLEKRGLQTVIFNKYFSVDAALRGKYKQWRNAFDNESRKVAVEISPDGKNEEEIYDFYKDIVTETVKQVTGKKELNEKKLKDLQDYILWYIMDKEKGEE